jgi:RHS repeat-associated protein
MPMAVRYTVMDGEILSETRNGVQRDYLPDPLGSTVALLDSSQNKTLEVSYWPYGETASVTGTGDTPFLFVGTLGYYRDTTNRTYVRARPYRQDLGQWMTLDPLWPREHPYVYGESQPLVSVDPMGFRSQSKDFAGTATCYSQEEGFKNCCTACGQCFNDEMECGPYAATLRTGGADWKCGDIVHCCYTGPQVLNPTCITVTITDTGRGTQDAVIDLGCCYAKKIGWIKNPNARLKVKCRKTKDKPLPRKCRSHDDWGPASSRGRHCQPKKEEVCLVSPAPLLGWL